MSSANRGLFAFYPLFATLVFESTLQHTTRGFAMFKKIAFIAGIVTIVTANAADQKNEHVRIGITLGQKIADGFWPLLFEGSIVTSALPALSQGKPVKYSVKRGNLCLTQTIFKESDKKLIIIIELWHKYNSLFKRAHSVDYPINSAGSSFASDLDCDDGSEMQLSICVSKKCVSRKPINKSNED